MSGEELLLARILGGPEVHVVSAHELDRRSLLGRRRPRRTPRREHVVVARNDGLLVA